MLLLPVLLINSAVTAQSWKQLHESAIVIDTHNDFLTQALENHVRIDSNLRGRTQSDLNRWRQGGVDIQVFSIWCDGSYADGRAYARANEEIDSLCSWIRSNPGRMMLVTNSRQLMQAVRQKKLGCMLGVEGGHMIENSLDKLDSLYQRGVRYLTLTWNNSTSWASSARDETLDSAGTGPKGLSEFGRQVVRHMNDLGMLVDLSHTGEQTFWDVLHTTRKPVLVSHSCARALCPVFRNLTDEQILAVGKNGGVIHLNFYSGFVDSNFFRRNEAFAARHRAERDSILKTASDPFFADDYLFKKYPKEVQDLRPPLDLLLDHLDHMVKLIGPDHVGLGSDFDGINSAPQQLDDVSDFPYITQALLKRGYSPKDIRKILGGNFIRLLKANESR